MGRALELITVQATAPGAGAPFLAVAGNSLTIRDTRSPAWLVGLWGLRNADGFFRLTSPLLHDAVVGVQAFVPASTPVVQHLGSIQQVFAQDSLVAFGSGSAVAGNIELNSMLMAYDDLPGVDAYLIDDKELQSRGENLYSFTNTLAIGTLGGYSGQELLTAEQDQLKANTDYAILGWNLAAAAQACAVRYVGQDWGNLGVGGPLGVGAGSHVLQPRWFQHLSEVTGMPLMPVFNSSNKSNTFIDAAAAQGGQDVTVTTMCVQLAKRGRGKRQ